MADVRLGDPVTTHGPSRRILTVLLVEFLLIVGGFTAASAFAANSGPHSGLTAKVFFWQQQTNSDAAAKANAVSVARQFVLNADAFTPANIKGYLANLTPLMTTKFQADQTKEYAQFEQLVGPVLSQVTGASKYAAMASTGSIQFAALGSFTGTTATVLVAHDALFAGVRPQQCASQPASCQTRRWLVTLRKIGGVWLVDNYNQNL